jgi:hypothetical protein
MTQYSLYCGCWHNFLENPGCIHWEAAKHMMRYLEGTMELKLIYGGGKQCRIEEYADADESTLDHRHAILGFAILVDGEAVSWSSKKQELMTLSTIEAKYVGTTHAAKELIWFCCPIKEVFRPLIFPTILHLDNQSVIILANSKSQFHTCTKHIYTLSLHQILYSRSLYQLDLLSHQGYDGQHIHKIAGNKIQVLHS